MLTNLIKRINKDENRELDRQIIVECAHAASMSSHIEKFGFIDSDVNCDDLKATLEAIELSDSDSVEVNMDKLLEGARSPETILEAVVSTSKTISMTKEDYDELLELLKVLKKSTSEPEDKKNAKTKIKSFLKACAKEIRKCDDNRPADALVVAMINKLCNVFDCTIENSNDADEKITKKALLALKINALAKAISHAK